MAAAGTGFLVLLLRSSLYFYWFNKFYSGQRLLCVKKKYKKSLYRIRSHSQANGLAVLSQGSRQPRNFHDISCSFLSVVNHFVYFFYNPIVSVGVEQHRRTHRNVPLCHIVQIDSQHLLWSYIWLLHIVLCRTIQTEPFLLLRFSLCTSFLWLCHTFFISIRNMWSLSLMRCPIHSNALMLQNYYFFVK